MNGLHERYPRPTQGTFVPNEFGSSFGLPKRDLFRVVIH